MVPNHQSQLLMVIFHRYEFFQDSTDPKSDHWMIAALINQNRTDEGWLNPNMDIVFFHGSNWILDVAIRSISFTSTSEMDILFSSQRWQWASGNAYFLHFQWCNWCLFPSRVAWEVSLLNTTPWKIIWYLLLENCNIWLCLKKIETPHNPIDYHTLLLVTLGYLDVYPIFKHTHFFPQFHRCFHAPVSKLPGKSSQSSQRSSSCT